MKTTLEMITEARATLAENGWDHCAVHATDADGTVWTVRLTEVRCPGSTKRTERINWLRARKPVSAEVARAALG